MPWPFAKKPIQTETKTSVSEVQMMHPDGHDYALNDWRAYAKEGYKQNPTVYRCISLIAKNAASVRPYLKRGEEYIEDHPLLDLLQRPNPITGGQEFREEAYSWALLTGNIFCDRSIVGGRVAEMHHWQPYGMKIHRSKANIQIPHSYEAENKRTWEVDAVSGASDMMHLGLYNPDPNAGFMGLSPLAAAASSADQLNAGNEWRYNLYKNDCRPSGLLSTEQPVTSSQRKELGKDMDSRSGAKNAGRWMILGGGLKYQQLSQSAKDVDWLNGSKFSKQEIAEVFGVPTQLLGIEGSQTYANFEEARYALYLLTVMPLVDLYFDELNRWLTPLYGEDLKICYDKSSIDALEYVRQRKTETMLNSSVLTINEKRELLGLPPRGEAEADQLFIDPNMLPLGFEAFNSEEQAAQDAAKAFVRMGMKRSEAEVKAWEVFNGQCHHERKH